MRLWPRKSNDKIVARSGQIGPGDDLGRGNQALDRRSYTEIGVSALVVLACAVFLVQAYRLPPGTFEPLGSGPVPIVTASIVILCCIVVIIRAMLTLANEQGAVEALRAEFSGGSPLGALPMLGGSVIYVGLLHLQVAPFGLLTFAFLTALIWAMERFNPRKIPVTLIVAAIFAFGAEYLFTNVFFVDLPT